jgi:hypothetical protein
MVWLQKWRLRGDRLGLLRNSIEYCSLVLQKLSERWASAGIPPEPSTCAPDFASFVPVLLNPFYVIWCFFSPLLFTFICLVLKFVKDRYLTKLRDDAANMKAERTVVTPSLCTCMHPGMKEEGLVRVGILHNLLEAIRIYGGESP